MRRLAIFLFACLLVILLGCRSGRENRIVIASKNFTEQIILAGAIPAALLALLADFSLGWAERRLRVPR